MSLPNYFELLQLDLNYNVDVGLLDKNYFQLQLKYHPDRACDEAQKKSFLTMSAAINEAYEHLGDSLKRAKALLAIKGVNLDDHKSELDSHFLQQVLDEAEQVDSCIDGAKLSQMLANKYLQKKDIVAQLGDCFQNQEIAAAIKYTIALRYVDNIIDKIKQKLQKISI
jgi:molecular chaperone HscB